MLSRRRTLTTLAGATAALGLAFLTGPAPAAAAGAGGDVYPLATCPVTGRKLGEMADPVVYNHEGREIRFCCGDCVGTFKKDPAKYIEKIDAEIVKQQAAAYPLDTCVVSGEKLGEMGKPYDYVYKNRLVRFCCPGCKSQFEKDPAKYIEKIDQAVIEKQKADYPLETCVVSGQKLGMMGDPVDYVVADRLVRFCCGGCVSTFEKDPVKYLTAIDQAAAKTGSAGATASTESGSGMKGTSGQHEPAGHGENAHNH